MCIVLTSTISQNLQIPQTVASAAIWLGPSLVSSAQPIIHFLYFFSAPVARQVKWKHGTGIASLSWMREEHSEGTGGIRAKGEACRGKGQCLG